MTDIKYANTAGHYEGVKPLVNKSAYASVIRWCRQPPTVAESNIAIVFTIFCTRVTWDCELCSRRALSSMTRSLPSTHPPASFRPPRW